MLADESGLRVVKDISSYDSPAWTALVRIGRPAVPAMIENIEASDNRILRGKSLDVLYFVLGGKRPVLELLTKLKTQAKDQPKIQCIEIAIQHTPAHFKEDKNLGFPRNRASSIVFSFIFGNYDTVALNRCVWRAVCR